MWQVQPQLLFFFSLFLRPGAIISGQNMVLYTQRTDQFLSTSDCVQTAPVTHLQLAAMDGAASEGWLAAAVSGAEADQI